MTQYLSGRPPRTGRAVPQRRGDAAGLRRHRRLQPGADRRRHLGLRRRSRPSPATRPSWTPPRARWSSPTARSPRPRSSSAGSGSSRRPTSTQPSRSPVAARQRADSPSRSGPSSPSDRPRVGLPGRARTRGGRPGPSVRRPRPGRGRHRRGPAGRRRALAHRRSAAQPGRLAHHGRRPQGTRPHASREAAPGQVRRGGHAHRHAIQFRWPTGTHRTRRGRPAPARLHLLPPGPRTRRTGWR